MDAAGNYLSLDDETLFRQCEMHTYRSSGPGGQHRNKVSSAVRLHHGPTGLRAHGDESRSQHDNKLVALRRLRMAIALQLRTPIDPAGPPPAVVRECIFAPRGVSTARGLKRLGIGARDKRFWLVASYLLDLLNAVEGRLADAAGGLGITSSNLVTVFQSDRHLLAAAQEIRKRFGQKPLL